MIRSARIARFIALLADSRPGPKFANPYHRPEPRHNLELFLARAQSTRRTLLLIGEAPGYRGAAVSGVPLTSVGILTDPWDDVWGAFGPTAGYMIPEWGRYRREATATMVWAALAGLFGQHPLPLTWNAVPFHPLNGRNSSNAPLSARDIYIGTPMLEGLLDLFPNSYPVALGHRAAQALHLIGVHKFASIRHPSRGGKSDFVAGLTVVRGQLEHAERDTRDDSRFRSPESRDMRSVSGRLSSPPPARR
jgi:hypothetical protein